MGKMGEMRDARTILVGKTLKKKTFRLTHNTKVALHK
jgi:hypothetical protein